MCWSPQLYNLVSLSFSRTSSAHALIPRIFPLGRLRIQNNSNNIRSRFQSSSSRTPNGEGVPAKPSLFQRFKTMYKDYWYVLVPVHVVTSLGWIGGFYYAVSSGFDLSFYMRKVGFSESIVEKITRSGAGNLAVAYALYKLATPARYTVTLGGTTLAINSLRNMGYIRPAKELYSSNKEKFQKFQKTLENKKVQASEKGKGSSS